MGARLGRRMLLRVLAIVLSVRLASFSSLVLEEVRGFCDLGCAVLGGPDVWIDGSLVWDDVSDTCSSGAGFFLTCLVVNGKSVDGVLRKGGASWGFRGFALASAPFLAPSRLFSVRSFGVSRWHCRL